MIKQSHRIALQQLVALMRADPKTKDYDIIISRHYKLNPCPFVAKAWGKILKIGIANELIYILATKEGKRTLTLGRKAPKDTTSLIQEAVDLLMKKVLRG